MTPQVNIEEEDMRVEYLRADYYEELELGYLEQEDME